MTIWQAVATIISLSVTSIAGGQSATDSALLRANQGTGFWTDPATNLMWAAKDNGTDVSWKGAGKYCKNLSLAGSSGWKVPTLDELKGLYDKNAESPGLMGAARYHNVGPSTWHIKGNLFLTGTQWSSNGTLDDRRKATGYKFYFNFNDGRSDRDPTGWPYPFLGMRVLCVHGTPKQTSGNKMLTWQFKDAPSLDTNQMLAEGGSR